MDELLNILSSATFEDVKVGLYVISAFMTIQVTSSVARYYFGFTTSPFDLIARLFSPNKCCECKKVIEDCTCFKYLKEYMPGDMKDD